MNGKFELISEEMFCEADYYIMENLWKIIPSDRDKELIYLLYRKYINSDALPPITGCGSCGLSIYKYYDKLRDFWCQNGDKFKKTKNKTPAK